jgi:hypothetical protein
MNTDFGWEASRKETIQVTKHRWEDNIKMDLREIECESADWIHLPQDKIQ